MGTSKHYYILALSAEDKELYLKLAQSMGKSGQTLVINLYLLYHDFVEQGGERFNRIRAAVPFGRDVYGDERVPVKVIFSEAERDMLYASARDSGKTIRGFIVDLVKYGIFKAGIECSPETEKTVKSRDTQVKRKRGRPKGSRKQKDEPLLGTSQIVSVEKEERFADSPPERDLRVVNPVNSGVGTQEESSKEKPGGDSVDNALGQSIPEKGTIQEVTGILDGVDPEQDEETLRAIRRRRMLFNGLKDGNITLN